MLEDVEEGSVCKRLAAHPIGKPEVHKPLQANIMQEVIFGQAVWLHVYDLTASFHLPVLNSALLRTGAQGIHVCSRHISNTGC